MPTVADILTTGAIAVAYQVKRFQIEWPTSGGNYKDPPWSASSLPTKADETDITAYVADYTIEWDDDKLTSICTLTLLHDYEERAGKAIRQHELAVSTRDYNLGTSLKNYIDPRVFKAWGDHIGFDWSRLYTTALRRKFAWVNQSRTKWA